jgi:hypothetical protein
VASPQKLTLNLKAAKAPAKQRSTKSNTKGGR